MRTLAFALSLGWLAMLPVAAQEAGARGNAASAANQAAAPEDPSAILQELQNDVLRVFISARVIGSDESILWNMELDELTVPGRGVDVRLNGQNVVVEVEFTPYRQEEQTIMLVAQGQTWITNDEDNKVRYQTSLKSIPVNSGEPVVFYPLGVDPGNGNTVNLELEITVSNYAVSENPQAGGQ